MSPDEKIVPIAAARGEATAADASRPASTGAAITRRMSAPAIQLRELLQRNLSKKLQEMFDSVDDALFELAEHAPNNQQQNIFFESMREVRFKRVEIEKHFLEGIQQEFVALFSDGAQSSARLSGTGEGVQNTAEALSIMDEDSVEEMVAVDSMVAKFNKALSGPLAALDARLAHLAGMEVTRFGSVNIANPVCPKQLCRRFSDACRLLNIDIKARIVVFKFFEKTVLSSLETLYKQANDRLVRANVLPDYRGSVAVPRGPAKSDGAIHGADLRSEAALSERAITVVEAQQQRELSQLISFVPQYGLRIGNPASESLAGALQLLQTSQYPDIENEVLLQLLHSLQCQQGMGVVQGGGQASALAALQRPEDLLLNLATRLAAASDNGEHAIGQRERDVIGLVSMLFQFVLEDRVVSEPMKAALSRLQVPIIKVALNESNFFCSPSHPARRLLNEMTESVVGWVESEDYHNDPLYQMVCSTVERISREYERDAQLFVDVLADFKSWLDSENKRSELRGKRLVDAESGRDESNRARQEVKAFVEALPLQGVPDFVCELAEKVWSNLLFLAYVQEGPSGERWANGKATLEKLLWTVAAGRSVGDRADILRELPQLLKSLRQGLESINHDKRACSSFFEKLERAHMQVMQRSEPLAIEPQADTTPESTAAAQQAARGDAALSATGPVEVQSAEVTAGGNAHNNAGSNARDNAHYRAAKSMAVGQWVELSDEGGKKRCRLVAILRNSGKRIFVNRAGSKAAELDLAGIARLLESGEMLPLEDAQLFDKALTSIIDGLRKQQHEAVGT